MQILLPGCCYPEGIRILLDQLLFLQQIQIPAGAIEIQIGGIYDLRLADASVVGGFEDVYNDIDLGSP